MSGPIHIRNETNELRLLFEVSQVLEATGDLGSQMETILEFMASHTAMLWGGITLSARGEVSRKAAPAKRLKSSVGVMVTVLSKPYLW